MPGDYAFESSAPDDAVPVISVRIANRKAMLYSVILGLSHGGDRAAEWTNKVLPILSSVGFVKQGGATYHGTMTLAALNQAMSGVFSLMSAASGATLDHLFTYVSKADTGSPMGR